MNGNLTLFIIRCKYYKQNHYHLQKYLSCHSTLGRYIHRIYHTEFNLRLSPSVLSKASCKFYSSSIIFFFIAVLIRLLICRDEPDCCSSWITSLLTTVPDGVFFPLSLPATFSALLWCYSCMSVLFNEAFALSWKIFIGSFLTIYSPFNL